jgi:two-component system chemotaxis response regulator CheB
MPAAFTGPFAKRLDGLCKISVKEAESGERAQPGCAYVSPGGKHIRVQLDKGHMVMTISSQPEDALYKPSANVLIESAASLMARRVLGAVLTGMGNDGLEGAKVLKAKGGRLLAQSDTTCVVYGMPKAIVDAGLADEIVDIGDMALAFRVNLFK